jgi:hypothetical protein
LGTMTMSAWAGDLNIVGNANVVSNLTATSMASADQYFRWDAVGGCR